MLAAAVKRIPIIIYNIDVDDYYLKIFKDLNYKVILRRYSDYKHDIYECDTMEESIKSALNLFYIAHNLKEGNLDIWKQSNKKSLKTSTDDADIFEMIKWNQKIKDLVKLGNKISPKKNNMI